MAAQSVFNIADRDIQTADIVKCKVSIGTPEGVTFRTGTA